MSRIPDPSTFSLWSQRFNRFHSSGLSIARFCTQENISTHWAKRVGPRSQHRQTQAIDSTFYVDMRKSFDGLCGIVQAEFARDILDGDLYLILNRRGDRIKAMYWDRDGIAILMKKKKSEDTPL